MDITDNSSFDEANIDALVEEVVKLNGEKLNLRRELEARWAVEDLIKERDHEIAKIKQENASFHERWHEEKEEK